MSTDQRAANKAMVREMLAHLETQDFEKAFADVTADFTWWTPERLVTEEEMRVMFVQLKPHFKTPMTITVITETAEDDRVAVEAQSRCELTNGRVYNNQYHFLVRVRDGHIASVREHNDTKHAADIFGDIIGGVPEDSTDSSERLPSGIRISDLKYLT